MLAGFEGVVDSGDGTAYGAFAGWPSAPPVAGKTGTAQVQQQGAHVGVRRLGAGRQPEVRGRRLRGAGRLRGVGAPPPLPGASSAGIYGMPLPAPVYIANAAVN